MTTYTAQMRVTYEETWTVEAASEDEAKRKFLELTEDVIDDDTGGEVVDWEVVSMKKEKGE